MTYHKSVLINESIEALNIKSNGIYLDVTFGGGGHSRKILEKLDGGKLFAFDRDIDVLSESPTANNFKLIITNYKNIKRFLRKEGVFQVDGILADLGVSSHQLDVAERGFSFRFNSELDMRMNRSSELTAKVVLNEYTLEHLSDIFFNYGDLYNSRKISELIVNSRKIKNINTTNDLIELLKNITPARKKSSFLSRIFQSIRIEVNQEIESLKKMLEDGVELLNNKSRFVVISYHSIEDRLVKNLFKRGSFSGEVKKDFYGNNLSKIRQVNQKIITPSILEIKKNNRSRSAKLRIAEKII
tara:strand:- start:256 stop:1155 length:900 start_codon:yes stop_codon:yes gene_type:complete